ncbi:unnamed protein product [Closterium sp. Yama58-4]|nr:unnamed protein product [Closterium sp. Yama58-4]
MPAVVAVAAASRARRALTPLSRLTPLTPLSRLTPPTPLSRLTPLSHVSRLSRLARITPSSLFNASRVVCCKNRPPRRLASGWSSRLLSRISFLATILCAAIILVIASICFCFCMCCRQVRRAESSFDEVFLADYIACSTHHYDPLLKLGSGPFGDSFPCSGPEGEPWLVVRTTIPDGLAGATWLPWTGAAAKRRAFNEEINRFSGLSHPHLLHLIGWSDQPLGQAGGSRRLRQVGESMRQWAQILWRKRGAQEQGEGAGSGRGEGGGSGRGEGEGDGSGRAEGEALGQAGTQGRVVGTAGGEEGREERGKRGKAGDQHAASSDCGVEVGGEGAGKEGKGGKGVEIVREGRNGRRELMIQGRDSDAQSPPPLAFSQRLDIATAVAEALCHLHTAAQPPLVLRGLCSSSVFLEVLPVARLANLGIIKGLPSSPCLLQQCHVAAPHRDPDWWERMWPTTRTDIYGWVYLSSSSCFPNAVPSGAYGCSIMASAMPIQIGLSD